MGRLTFYPPDLSVWDSNAKVRRHPGEMLKLVGIESRAQVRDLGVVDDANAEVPKLRS
jgi:hypothetical protein